MLGHEADAALRHLVRGEPVRGLAAEAHLPLRGLHHARDGFERGGLACAVAAQQGDELAVAYAQRDALQHVALAVVGVDVLHREKRCDGYRSTFALMRCGAMNLRSGRAAHALPPVIMLPR
ncbi:hypothetical protein ALISP_5487 [Alicycliphilus sp. B1]|nr:hypothetical protein ALISP_5487 [Alicycliphilus sp. B1]